MFPVRKGSGDSRRHTDNKLIRIVANACCIVRNERTGQQLAGLRFSDISEIEFALNDSEAQTTSDEFFGV